MASKKHRRKLKEKHLLCDYNIIKGIYLLPRIQVLNKLERNERFILEPFEYSYEKYKNV